MDKINKNDSKNPTSLNKENKSRCNKKKKMMKRVYKDSYGDEDVLGTRIWLYKNQDKYKLIVEQETYESEKEYMHDVETNYTVISKDVKDRRSHEGGEIYMCIRTIKMIIVAASNPPPKSVFKIKD